MLPCRQAKQSSSRPVVSKRKHAEANTPPAPRTRPRRPRKGRPRPPGPSAPRPLAPPHPPAQVASSLADMLYAQQKFHEARDAVAVALQVGGGGRRARGCALLGRAGGRWFRGGWEGFGWLKGARRRGHRDAGGGPPWVAPQPPIPQPPTPNPKLQTQIPTLPQTPTIVTPNRHPPLSRRHPQPHRSPNPQT